MPEEINFKPRELEILQLLKDGLSDSEIATRLHLANNTIRWYNKKIFEKLEVSNRTQAVKRASELNLLNGQKRGVALHQNKVEKSPVKYVLNGDVHIAYQVIGNGPVDLLFIHGFLSNLELAWEQPEFTNFFEELGKCARVILFDKRGVGLSDRIQGAPSLENTIDDAICVLNAVASEQTFVMGTSEGGASAVLLASTFPERVHGLILYAATPKLVRDNNEPSWAGTQAGLNTMIESLQSSWGEPWAIEQFAPSRANDETFRAWWSKILRSSSSPSSIKSVIDVLRDIDICNLLSHIQVRTLVIHKRDDRMVNVEAGRYFATHMPNAKWVELKGTDHIYFVESASLISEISQFIQEKLPTQTTDTWIGIVMVIHDVNIKQNENKIQTELTSRLCKNVFFSNNEIIAVFDSPSRAIQCAMKLRDIIKDQTLKISLNVGECNLETNKPSAAVTDMARRVSSQGKIVVTQTLRDILAGSGVVFDLNQFQIGESKAENVPFYTIT